MQSEAKGRREGYDVGFNDGHKDGFSKGSNCTKLFFQGIDKGYAQALKDVAEGKINPKATPEAKPEATKAKPENVKSDKAEAWVEGRKSGFAAGYNAGYSQCLHDVDSGKTIFNPPFKPPAETAKPEDQSQALKGMSGGKTAKPAKPEETTKPDNRSQGSGGARSSGWNVTLKEAEAWADELNKIHPDDTARSKRARQA